MAWVSLFLAGMFEVVGVLGMNRIKRDNNAKAYLLFSSGIIMSFIFFEYINEKPAYGDGLCHMDRDRYCWRSVRWHVFLR